MFKTRYRYAFILLLSGYSYLNIYFTVGDNQGLDLKIPGLVLLGVLTATVLSIWELNRFSEKHLSRLSRRVPKIHPLILLFLISLLNVVVSVAVELTILYALLGLPMKVNYQHLTLLFAFGFRVNLFLNCVNAIVFFMNRLKKTELEAEQLKKITIEAQFEALRNQINPHFLFNCFNVLSTLVYKDSDTSATFISQLSNVYRYLLYNQQRKVVPLSEELSFIESYLFLLQIRFGENIVVKVAVSPEAEKMFVAPAVLQMLIENAIKHNVISKKNPLAISVFSDSRGITVVNSLHLKPNPQESSHLGLNNIRQRYAFLSDQPIQIIKSDDDFTVKIPLLAISES